MKNLLTRSTLRFASDLLLGDFLPTEDDASLHIQFTRSTHSGRVFLAQEDLNKFSAPHRAHLPEAVKKNHAMTRMFTLELRFPGPSSQAVQDVVTGKRSTERSALLNLVAHAVRIEHALLRDIMQDYFKMGRCKIDLLESEEAEAYLASTETRLCYSGKWNVFRSGGWQRKTSIIHAMQPLTREGWCHKLRPLFENQMEAPVWHRFLASAVAHLEYDARLALIDSVTALEAIVRGMVPAVLEKHHALGPQSSAWIEKNLIVWSIHQTVRTVFPLLEQYLPVLAGLEAQVLKLIERRNEFIHKLRRASEAFVGAPEAIDAIELVSKIAEVIECEYRAHMKLPGPAPIPVSSMRPKQIVTLHKE